MPELERAITLTERYKSIKMLKSEKGHNLDNIYKISPEVNQITYTMIPDCLQKFINLINLALRVLDIFCLHK